MKGLDIRGNEVKFDLRKSAVDVKDQDAIFAPEALTIIDHPVLPPNPNLENHVLKRNC